MDDTTLIAEDLLLLLLDDKSGTPAGAGTLHYTLGGALLVELALLGRVETGGDRPKLNGPQVLAIGDGPLPDPMPRRAYDKIAERPRNVQSLLLAIGGGLWKPLTDRLVERGLLRRESKRLLGVFNRTTLPIGDGRHEEELRRKVCAVLEDGAAADPRTAAVIALLSASGTLPSLHPRPRWSGEVYQRAKQFEEGDWGASAVHTVVVTTVT
ncbi:GOLPH3/VPS74 family protein [Amycolatopsis albispora]|uniref:GPP34 family phosphoprotein n=1 Tax=Amycolatopsis albispora TaxID=1804986 RepID=A0A344L2T1_9PSEU|nr:GPP34 family phosphoprotein [Amycolatopsis albispora]AXB42355.1 hypothetical protein A4R43_07300 [Amycolatopsis albispora]